MMVLYFEYHLLPVNRCLKTGKWLEREYFDIQKLKNIPLSISHDFTASYSSPFFCLLCVGSLLPREINGYNKCSQEFRQSHTT